MAKIVVYITKVVIIIATLLLFLACQSDDSNDNTTSTDINAVVAVVTNGTWKITYYYDSDKEETSNFSGYTFTFTSNGVLTATNGTLTHSGTWSISNDDDNKSDLDFNIAFSAPATFVDLTEDWDIIEKTSTSIKLKDVSGGDGLTDYLTFTKM